MKTFEQDVQDLMTFFENASKQSDPELGDRDVDKANLKGTRDAYAFASVKIKRMLQWHGLLPGGMPVKS